jgi:hypothetical protein
MTLLARHHLDLHRRERERERERERRAEAGRRVEG